MDLLTDISPTGILAALVSAATSGLGTYFWFRKQISELRRGEADHAVTGYKAVIDTMKSRLDDLVSEVHGLSHRLAEVRGEHDECLSTTSALKLRIATLEADQETLRRRVGVRSTRFSVRVDLEGKILDVSHGVENVLGYRATKLIGEPITHILLDANAAPSDANVLASILEGHPVNVAARMQAKHKGGGLLVVVVSVYAERNDDRQVISALINVAEDTDELSVDK